MFEHPATQIDFRPYAGQQVLIACAAETEAKHTIYYVLGTLGEQGQLPEHVLAIIADDQEECSELMFVVLVEGDGTVRQWHPLVVLNEHGQLCYGQEFVAAAVATGQSLDAYTIWGVHVPS
jgi:hypothetical protein